MLRQVKSSLSDWFLAMLKFSTEHGSGRVLTWMEVGSRKQHRKHQAGSRSYHVTYFVVTHLLSLPGLV